MRAARVLTILIPAATLVLMMLGGYVHSVGASLACPDWPLCYGQVFPRMQGGILWEHSHRLLAGGIGLAALALAAACWRQRSLRVAALGGGLLIAFQGVLGGLTVIFRLPPLVSICHLATSMLVLAWSLVMFFRVRAAEPLPRSRPALAAPRRGVAVAALFVYVQIVLGSLVRHTQSSMACGTDVLTCAGAWLPATPPQVLQTLHRVTAILAGLAVWTGTVGAMRWARKNGRAGVRPLGVLAHTTVLAQWGIGAWVVKTAVHSHVVTLHLGLGAVLWGALVAMYLMLGPLGVRRTRQVARPASGTGSLPATTPVSDLHGAC